MTMTKGRITKENPAELTPREPTPEMLADGRYAYETSDMGGNQLFKETWIAMLDAAEGKTP